MQVGAGKLGKIVWITTRKSLVYILSVEEMDISKINDDDALMDDDDDD